MNLNNELKSGIIISAIGKYSNYIIQFVLLAILSRLLTPDDFGIVAIVNVFLIFFTMLIDLGIGPAVIQNKELTDKQVNGIFSFTVLLSILFSVLFALMSEPIAKFYNNDQLVGVCLVMAVALLSSGLNMVPQSILLRQKKFLDVNFAQILSSIISGVVGTILALLDFSYYALVISAIVKNIMLFIIMFPRTKLKLTKNILKKDLNLIYSFSRNQFLFNFINYFSRNLDNILIGKFISTKALALYDKAYILSLYPNQILTNVITPVIQPIMSEYEDRKDIIKKTYLLLSRLLAFIGMPLTVFLFFSSKEVIFILFGSQWEGSVATFQILALSIWIQMILSSTGSIFQSANRTDLLLISGLLSAFLNIISIIVGVWSGKIENVALLLLIAFFLNFIQANYLLMIKVFQSRQIEFYKILLDPLIISSFILASLLFIKFLFGHWSMLILFVVKALVSLIVFLIGMKVTGNIDIVKKILKKQIK
ncbi:lipopolysaccharide biosynthesis protein [Bacillus sp. 03113]|uniref:lipopolysaccharide biosynthesis protein n=1 Tax=Bacillus sp. 03113 TaxID=2578211 RepID=UPI0011447CD1|nr:lipopolysaccharide biosynthesis protein [Bacillus sp. 03113]